MMKFLVIMASIFSYLSVSSQTTENITDSRDGKVYKTIQIGSQKWIAENINFETDYSWCIDCEIFGRVYSYESALKSCPAGWHLPTDAEWTMLIAGLGGFSEAGGKLKESGTTFWKSPNTGATNESGFKAIPHGYRSLNGILNFAKKMGSWWTSSEENQMRAWSYRLDYDKKGILRIPSEKFVGVSVRCIKDKE
jgi:uncharacterized protein (TIGR02145 family)